MLGSNFTEITREAWCTIPGRSCDITFNSNNKPTQIIFLYNYNPVFIQRFTYDTNGNCIKIECLEPTNNE